MEDKQREREVQDISKTILDTLEIFWSAYEADMAKQTAKENMGNDWLDAEMAAIEAEEKYWTILDDLSYDIADYFNIPKHITRSLVECKIDALKGRWWIGWDHATMKREAEDLIIAMSNAIKVFMAMYDCPNPEQVSKISIDL